MTASGTIADKFTLIVPTYNRPAELSRLLAYLSRHQASFPVLILDSSEPATQQANKVFVAKLDCNIRLESFDPQVSPWEKFWRGSELIETKYCSLCADDDLVLPKSLDQLVGFLEEHPDHSVAHGWYFTFYDNVHIGITTSVYRGASLDQADPLDRLVTLFKNYEAVTYGIYRTPIMQSVLGDVEGVGSMLAKELLGGALATVRGKVARLPILYYGRSLAPSQPYIHWHPLDFLVSSPDGLYRDYASYRRILLACFKATGYDKYAESELVSIIDLIHFRYLADYVKPRVMEYLVGQMMVRAPKQEIMQGLWSVLARENDPSLGGVIGGSRLLRRIRDQFFPRIRLHHLRRYSAPAEHRTVRSTTASGRQREYLFYTEFLSALASNAMLESGIEKIVTALDNYE